MLKNILLSLMIAVLLLPSTATAQNINNALSNLGRVGERAGTTEGDIGNIIGTVINAALTLVGITFLILMVYAGYLWMTARGEEAPIENAKKIVKAAIIGLVLVMSAYAITFFVTSRFERAGTPATPRQCVPAQAGIQAATCSGFSEAQCQQDTRCRLQ